MRCAALGVAGASGAEARVAVCRFVASLLRAWLEPAGRAGSQRASLASGSCRWRATQRNSAAALATLLAQLYRKRTPRRALASRGFGESAGVSERFGSGGSGDERLPSERLCSARVRRGPAALRLHRS